MSNVQKGCDKEYTLCWIKHVKSLLNDLETEIGQTGKDDLLTTSILLEKDGTHEKSFPIQ